MNMGKKITDLREVEEIPGGSSYIVEMGDGTGTKKVTHNHLVNQLLTDMEMPYDETLAMLRAADENGDQKIPNVKAISDWIASKITNNLLATEEGFFLDARLGPIIDTRFKAVEDRVTQINSDLNNKVSSSSTGRLAALELTSDTPFIDFHFGSSGRDYTSRIIESSEGNLNFLCSSLMMNGSKLITNRLMTTNSGAIQQGCMGLFIGTTAELKEYLNQNWICPFIFIDTTKDYSGISIPLHDGNTTRGLIQIYGVLSGDTEFGCRKLIDGNYYGNW